MGTIERELHQEELSFGDRVDELEMKDNRSVLEEVERL
jgi:hypothetical protein